MKLTRRQLSGAILMPMPLFAQGTAAPTDELLAAKQQNQRNADQLRKVNVPIAAEPSIVFKA